MSFDLSGFVSGLNQARSEIERRAKLGVDQFAEVVIGTARDYAPVDTASLQNSGTAQPAEITGDSIEAQVGFDTDYAAAVHERLDMQIKTVKNPRARSKYLTTALQEHADQFGPFVADALKGVI
jgi:hypothetical protein